MCARPNNCQSCTSCHATIATSLLWAPVQALVDGKIEIVGVPKHIAQLLEDQRDVLQPKLAAKVRGFKTGLKP